MKLQRSKSSEFGVRRTKIRYRIFLSTIYYLLSTILSGCQNRHLYKDTQVLMGTFVEVISPDKRAAPIVFEEVRRLEGLLSKYKPDSEVSKLNELGELAVSEDTSYILKKAKEFWQLTEGAFDISVGPLVHLWGFTDKRYTMPRDEEIKKTLNLVGSDKISFNERNNVVKFSVSGMKIDLGAIAKGYALDCAVKKLKENNVKSCLINAGGQIHALGDKSGEPWIISIQHPRGKESRGVLKLTDKAVATSGDYEQYFIKESKRYAHILNPKTGYPADSGVISATVIANDGLTADALATAIVVLGKEKGESLVKRFPGVEAKIIEEKDVQNH